MAEEDRTRTRTRTSQTGPDHCHVAWSDRAGPGRPGTLLSLPLRSSARGAWHIFHDAAPSPPAFAPPLALLDVPFRGVVGRFRPRDRLTRTPTLYTTRQPCPTRRSPWRSRPREPRGRNRRRTAASFRQHKPSLGHQDDRLDHAALRVHPLHEIAVLHLPIPLAERCTRHQPAQLSTVDSSSPSRG